MFKSIQCSGLSGVLKDVSLGFLESWKLIIFILLFETLNNHVNKDQS
jgi:hypothetical protein